MKYLYNDKEKIRYLNVFFGGLYCIYLILWAINSIIFNVSDKAGLLWTIVFLVIEIILLFIWYPDEVKRKKALENGEFFQGEIIDIKTKKAKNIGLSRTSYVYTIIIEIDKNDKKEIIELGDYIDNPREYIPHNIKCKVYQYEDKYYFQRFKLHKDTSVKLENANEQQVYYHLLNKKQKKEIINNLKYPIEKIEEIDKQEAFKAAIERTYLVSLESKNCMYILPMYFKYLNPYSILFIEVHIESKKMCNGFSYDVGEEVQKFMNERPINDEYPKEQFVSDIKKMVKHTINSKDKKVKVNDIIIVLK